MYDTIPGSETIWRAGSTREACLERGRRIASLLRNRPRNGVALEMKMDGVLQAEQGIHRLGKGPPLRALLTPGGATARGQPVILAFTASSHSFPATGDEALTLQVM